MKTFRFFCWDICDLGVKSIGKHLKVAAGKASWNINMPPKKSSLHSKSCEHSGWQLSKKQNKPKGKKDKCQQAIPPSCQQMPSPEVYRLATILVLAGLYHGSIIRFASKAFRRSTGWFGGFREPREIWKLVLMSNNFFPLNWCAFLSFFFWPKSEWFEIWIDLGNLMRFEKCPLFFFVFPREFLNRGSDLPGSASWQMVTSERTECSGCTGSMGYHPEI